MRQAPLLSFSLRRSKGKPENLLSLQASGAATGWDTLEGTSFLGHGRAISENCLGP